MRRRSLVLFPFTVVLAIACQNQPTVPSEGETEGGPPGAAGLGDWESPGAHGQTLFAAGEYHEAIREFRQAAALSPLHRQTYYLDWVAASYLALREYEKVLDICEEIHRIDRDDLYALASRLRAYQELGRNAEGLELAERALRRKGPGGTADEAEILRHYAYFLAETGSLARSIEVYEALLAGGEPIADFADHLRLQYVKAGRYRDAFAAWRAKWGSGVAFWEGNQFGARYENVRRLSGLAEDARPSALRPSMASAPPRGGFAPSASPGALPAPGGETSPPDPPLPPPAASTEILFHLGKGYAGVGWLEEAIHVLSAAAAEGALPEARELAGNLTRSLSLATSIRARVYREYRAYLGGDESFSIDEALSVFSENARDLGFALAPDEVDDLSFFHRYVDPHIGGGRRLPAFFRRRGLLFVLFDFFGPVEVNLKRIVYLQAGKEKEVWGERLFYEIAVCESSLVYHYREFLGGSSYGGLAITPRGFWLDLDTYRRIARHLAGQYRRDRSSYEALFAPTEEDLDRAPDAVYFSGRLKQRLAYLVGLAFADEANGDTADLEERVTDALLESAEYHELGHLVIQRRYLPVGNHMLRGIGLLLAEGFSSGEIAAWSEEQAQLTALAHSRYAHLTLYRTVSSLAKSPDTSRHARGYERILAGFVAAILSDPGSYPNIRTDRPVVEQLYLLTGDQIRAIARQLYRG